MNRSQLILPPPQMVVTEMLNAVTGGGGTGVLAVVGVTASGPANVRLTGNDAGGALSYMRESSAYLAKSTMPTALVYDIIAPSAIDCVMFMGWKGAAGHAYLKMYNPGGGYVFSHVVDAVPFNFAVVLPVLSRRYRVHHQIIPGSGSLMRIEDMTVGGREGGVTPHVLGADTYQFTAGIAPGAAAAARSVDLMVLNYSTEI